MKQEERKRAEEALAEMSRTMSPEKLEFMVAMTHKVGVMTAVKATGGSKDFKVLAAKLFELKDGVIPLEDFEEIVTRRYPELISEGMIDAETGMLSMEALTIVNTHETMLNRE